MSNDVSVGFKTSIWFSVSPETNSVPPAAGVGSGPTQWLGWRGLHQACPSNQTQSWKVTADGSTHLLVPVGPQGSGWIGCMTWRGCPTWLPAYSPVFHLLCSWPKQVDHCGRLLWFSQPPAPRWCLWRSEEGSRERLNEVSAEQD